VRDLFAATILAATVLGLAACTSSDGEAATETVSTAWRVEIDTLRNGDLNEFERDALADYHISDQELSEAKDRFRSCARQMDPSYEVVFGEDGSTEIGPSDGKSNAFEGDAEYEHQGKILECEKGTTAIVFSVFYGMKSNPENLTYAELVRRCFEESGVPDGEGMSDDEFKDMLQPPGQDQLYVPSTAEGKACMDDPFASSSTR
jgi:hypothetical protein